MKLTPHEEKILLLVKSHPDIITDSKEREKFSLSLQNLLKFTSYLVKTKNPISGIIRKKIVTKNGKKIAFLGISPNFNK